MSRSVIGNFFVGEFDRGTNDKSCSIVDPCMLPAGTTISVGMGQSIVLPSMDFETYSEAGFTIDPTTGEVRGVGPQGKSGLPVVGTPVYAEHPSTEILCLKYNLKDGKGILSWYPGTPDPVDLLDHIRNGGLIEAWNVTFEFWIWNLIGERRYDWPLLTIEQCRCAMAKSRRFSLPGALGKAAAVLGTPEKDKAGGTLIQRLCRPLTPTKNRLKSRWTPATAWPDFLALYDYCSQDVMAEDCASAHIPDLTSKELTTWQMDQTINVRGVQVDTEALDAALDILGQTERKYTIELEQLTQGAVGSVSEVAKFGDWLALEGCPLPNLQKDTVAETLKREDLPPQCRRALEIRHTLGAANVKKLRTLKLQINSDGRLRDQYSYCGADRTGRAPAGGVQLQNITSKGPKSCECEGCGEFFGAHHKTGCPHCGCFLFHDMPDWTVKAVESAIRCVLTRDLSAVEYFWGNPIVLLCGCLRGLFIAKPGHDFVCVDFSAIEGVVAACLSRCQWRIEVYNTHGKMYEMSASKITGTPLEVYLDYKKKNGMHHPDRKLIGKIAELASQFGGWINAWKVFGADMADEDIKQAVLAWRAASPEIVDMWGGQFRWCGPGKWDYRPEFHGLEGMAIQAILSPGQCFQYLDITYGVKDDVLYARLPSGRYLNYHRPRLVPTEDKLNRGPAVSITFEGYNTNSANGPIGWHRTETFGGRLFENCIAEGTPVLTSDGWVPIEDIESMDLVHDGVEWVRHGGVLFKSKQPCISIDNVHMTPNHEVLTNDGWQTALQNPRPYRLDLRHVDCHTNWCERRQKTEIAISLRMGGYVRKVYDIVNAGPRQRFVVLGSGGPFIVHNCVQAVAADIQFEGLLRCETRGYPIVMHTHDEGISEVPEGFGSVDEMTAIMSERPDWASWWPLKATGWRHKRYQKD